MKLIRDDIPGIIVGHTRMAEPREIRELFRAKLLEEFDEYWEVRDYKDGRDVEELADLLEIIHSLMRRDEIVEASVYTAMHIKRQGRGGFDQGTVLIGENNATL